MTTERRAIYVEGVVANLETTGWGIPTHGCHCHWCPHSISLLLHSWLLSPPWMAHSAGSLYHLPLLRQIIRGSSETDSTYSKSHAVQFPWLHWYSFAHLFLASSPAVDIKNSFSKASPFSPDPNSGQPQVLPFGHYTYKSVISEDFTFSTRLGTYLQLVKV